MKTAHLILIALTCAGLRASADDDAPAPGYHTKIRSSFSAPDVTRDPFWPVGFVKPAASGPVAAVIAEQPVPELRADGFNVSSILIVANQRLAVINGKAYAQGETVAMIGNSFAVQVAAIQDGGIVLQCKNRQVTVPLRRESLASTARSGPVASNDERPADSASAPTP
jgi:hypothetical protein